MYYIKLTFIYLFLNTTLRVNSIFQSWCYFIIAGQIKRCDLWLRV